MHSRKGFTLTEIMISLIVVGILAAIAFPRYYNTLEVVKAKEGVFILHEIFDAQKAYLLEYGILPASIDVLDVKIPASNNFYNYGVNASSPPTLGATVTRRTGDYSLRIVATGEVFCANMNLQQKCSILPPSSLNQ